MHDTNSQRITVKPVSHLEMTLIVGTLDVVRFLGMALGHPGCFLFNLLLLPVIRPFRLRVSAAVDIAGREE